MHALPRGAKIHPKHSIEIQRLLSTVAVLEKEQKSFVLMNNE
jgi:hypothetical protein